jgi:hypothetical protein
MTSLLSEDPESFLSREGWTLPRHYGADGAKKQWGVRPGLESYRGGGRQQKPWLDFFPESGLLWVPFRGRAKSASFNRQPSAAIPIEVSSIAIHVAILTAQFPVLMAGGGIVTAVEIAAQLAAIM